MASTEGGTAEERKQTDASIPNDQPNTNTSSTFRQNGLQDSAQSWNPASQYALYMQWYYQYYYQMMYLSQLYNWQMFVSSQSLGSLPGSQFSPSVTGAASQTTGRQGFAVMQPNQPPAANQPSRPRPGKVCPSFVSMKPFLSLLLNEAFLQSFLSPGSFAMCFDRQMIALGERANETFCMITYWAD